MADVVIINKIDSARPEDVRAVHENIRRVNATATIIEAASPPHVENPALIRGKRVLAIEDGPTVTHGGMPYGVGTIAAWEYGAAEIVDPRPYAVGSIAETFRAYPQTGALLPAMGYGAAQVADLEATIRRTPCDVVVIGTPIDLRRVVTIDQPSVRVTYDLVEKTHPDLGTILADVLETVKR
jgi:predicted GTPase